MPGVTSIRRWEWYWMRLRAMSAHEVIYRIAMRALNLLKPHTSAPPARPSVELRGFDVDRTRIDITPYRAEATRIMQGALLIAPAWAEPMFPPDWHRDPLTGRAAPALPVGRIDIRTEAKSGNLRHVWEVNRHTELVRLSQAWWLTRTPEMLDACIAYLDSWFDACPVGVGVQWLSGYEAALRLVNWSFAWRFLEGLEASSATHRLRERWLASIGQHVALVRGQLSRYSSANNHLFAELLGLLVATTTWDFGPYGQRCKAFALDALQREAVRQFSPDGPLREQATCYHQQCLDMMLIAQSLFDDPAPFGAAWDERVLRAIEYLEAIADREGNAPWFGDADRAVLAPLAPDAVRRGPRSFFAFGAWRFGREDWVARVGNFDERWVWLFGDRVRETRPRAVDTPSQPTRRFVEGGLAILGHRFGEPREVRIVSDVGPLGYLSIAAHGHADALAFTLAVAGIPMLVDPGVASYRPDDPWREYFRGTAAHNTVVVDGLDQSVRGGSFMWLQKATVDVEAWESGIDVDRLVARHDGYSRLDDPVIHTRAWMFDKRTDALIVEDTLSCAAHHRVEIMFHLAPDVDVERTPRGVRCTSHRITGDVSIEIALDPRLEIALARGQVSPMQGWVAPRLEVKVPSWTIAARTSIERTTRFSTRIEIDRIHAARP